MSSLREKTIEASLVGGVKRRGGMCPKFTSPGMDGMPDRLVLLQHGHFGFVEVKAPGKKPRPLQAYRHRELRKLGFKTFVLDETEQIEGILNEIEGGDAT